MVFEGLELYATKKCINFVKRQFRKYVLEAYRTHSQTPNTLNHLFLYRSKRNLIFCFRSLQTQFTSASSGSGRRRTCPAWTPSSLLVFVVPCGRFRPGNAVFLQSVMLRCPSECCFGNDLHCCCCSEYSKYRKHDNVYQNVVFCQATPLKS